MPATLAPIPVPVPVQARPFRVTRFLKKAFKRIVPLALALDFIPWVLLAYVCCGVLDVIRNQRRTIANIDRYFAGNGVFTWLLSPFNLLMDFISLLSML